MLDILPEQYALISSDIMMFHIKFFFTPLPRKLKLNGAHYKRGLSISATLYMSVRRNVLRSDGRVACYARDTTRTSSFVRYKRKPPYNTHTAISSSSSSYVVRSVSDNTARPFSVRQKDCCRRIVRPANGLKAFRGRPART